ncbi:MAG: 30S ribosomal protein S3, partial [Candidatus Spechtbacteria bacterium RIFCSPLOWO2_01_FULL_38_20]
MKNKFLYFSETYMTHKTQPLNNRLAVTKEWRSRWFSSKKYKENVQQDYLIRKYILDNLKGASIAKIELERSANSVSVIIYTSRPGIIIGRAGTGVEQLKKDLNKLLHKKVRFLSGEKRSDFSLPELRIEVREIRESDANARLVALSIAEQIERRIPFRKVIKRGLDRVMANKDVKGARISV